MKVLNEDRNHDLKLRQTGKVGIYDVDQVAKPRV